MSARQFVRARPASPHAALPRVRPVAAAGAPSLQAVAQHMFSLMLRNVSSDGYQFDDPSSPGSFSKPGCVIAAPSYPANTPGVNQNYVFNWVRDAAITAIELAAAKTPSQPLIDYVGFARLCQNGATPTLGHAVFTIEGNPRIWSEQNDGPAIQTIAMLQAFDQLDTVTQATAIAVMNKNVEYLLGVYQQPTTNLWEEHSALSFFARAVQLKCFQEVVRNTAGVDVPDGAAEAVDWLRGALQDHWNGAYYVSLLGPPAPGNASPPAVPSEQGYDPNIDIIQAGVYGAIPFTDTKLLATAGQLRRQWADGGAPSAYPINLADSKLGLGPLLGRYPGDFYDGDTSSPVVGGHPWALCTCNFAELYYGLANEVSQSQSVPFDELSTEFFAQVGLSKATSPTAAATALRDAGDAMMQAVVYHSDNLELSEQFDGTSGYEKSVRDLTWSYAAFLSAARRRNAEAVEG